MKISYSHSLIPVCVSLTVAFALMVTPVPEMLRLLRPNLVLLALIYWLMRFPESIGVGGACLLGFVYDGVIGSPLGLHALSFSMVSAILLLLYSRWRMFALPQQLAWIFFLLLLDQWVVAWGYGFVGRTELRAWVWVSTSLGALCWIRLGRSASARH